MMLAAKVATGSSIEVRTIGWAAMCSTRSKSRILTSASTAAWSRRSTTCDSTRPAIPA